MRSLLVLAKQIFIILSLSVLGMVSLLGREVSFSIGVTSESKTGYTLLFPSKDILLISDEEGVFRSLVTDSNLVELEDGVYNYEIIFKNSSLEGSITVNETLTSPFEIVFAEDTVEGEEADEEENLSDNNVKRLSTVRVKGAGSSAKRVLTADEARKLPGTGGDVLTSLRSFPGVVTSGTLNNDLFIRGGGANDVSYRYKDVVIGSPYHEIFFFSVFPPEILSSIVFFPGGYPSEYENVQGSVVEILGKDFYDYEKDYSVDLNLSLIVASLSASIKLGDDFRITFGGRRSYIEAYIALADAIGLLDGLGSLELIPVFYDAHFLFEWQIAPTRKFEFTFLFSGDAFTFNVDNAEFRGASETEQIFIDSSFSFATLWDSESFRYSEAIGSHEYDITLYRYAERYKETNQEVESFNLTNEEYALRGDYSYLINDNLKIENYVKYSLDRGYGTNRIDPTGGSGPDPSDYLTFDANGMPNGASLLQFLEAIREYNSRLVPTTENFFRNRVAFSSALATTLRQVSIDSGFIVYYDDLSPNQINGDFRLRTAYLPNVRVGEIEFFTYAGRFTQFPAIALRNATTGELFIQDYPLEVPHTYQFGAGTVWRISDWELSFEPYYKLLQKQILTNPTYDSAFPTENNNFPTVNSGGGYAYGTELFFRKSGQGWFTGWLAYTWGRAFTRQFKIEASFDRGIVGQDPNNNGADYLNYNAEYAPFGANVEHSIKVLSGFKLSKSVNLSFRVVASSGKPYTPQVIGTNSQLVDPTCTPTQFLPCDNGRIFVNDPNRINGARLPWSLKVDLRLDWVFYRNKIVEASLFVDVLDFQSIFYENVGGYRYDRNFIRYSSIQQIGDAAPAEAIDSNLEATIVLPVIGFEFRF